LPQVNRAASMLTLAFALLALAVAVGAVLAVLHLREGRAAPPLALPALHGLLAITGFVTLLIALAGPPRGLQTGAASFGAIAAALLALAALLGFAMLALHLLRRRLPGVLIGAHATLAVSGFVILAVYVLVG
jgi:hypothetical protein